MKFLLNFRLFFVLAISLPVPGNTAFAQKKPPREECIYGDCKNGFGVYKTISSQYTDYFIGNFNKHKLSGNAVVVYFSQQNAEKQQKLLDALKPANQIPPVHDLLKIGGAVVEAEFSEGNVVGMGKKHFNDPRLLDYLAFFGFLQGSGYVLFEGSFLAHTKKNDLYAVFAKAGKYTEIKNNGDTMIVVADEDLYSPVIWERKGKKNGVNYHTIEKGKISSNNFEGWVLVNDVYPQNNKRNKDGEFFRQIKFQGKVFYEDEGRSYPQDEVNTQTIQLGGAEEISGPLVNGKVAGFGSINYNTNKKYEGYIKDNLPDGYGILNENTQEARYAKKYGIFRQGKLVNGTVVLAAGNGYTVYIHKNEENTEAIVTVKTYKTYYALVEDKPEQTLVGKEISGIGWDGEVKTYYGGNVADDMLTYVTTYSMGKYVSGVSIVLKTTASSAPENADALSDNSIGRYVVVTGITGNNKGIAVYLKQLYAGRDWILSDGSQVSKDDLKRKYKKSRHHVSEFFTTCSCGGTGQITTVKTVSGTSDTWNRTEQTTKSSSVGGYWQGVQNKSTTYNKAGYQYAQKSSCQNTDAKWVKLSAYGYKPMHSVAVHTQLKE